MFEEFCKFFILFEFNTFLNIFPLKVYFYKSDRNIDNNIKVFYLKLL